MAQLGTTFDPPTVLSLLSRLSQSEARIAELEGALRETATQAADWFTEYAALHRAKGTKDGDAKADTNVGRAAWLLGRIDAALHNTTEEKAQP